MARILIAEDEPSIRDLIAFTVRFAGHEVTTVTNGEEAVAAACESMPDLILLNVGMPKMNGYDACRALKMSSILKDIPVVFLSAKGQEAEIREGMEAGAEAYLLKPFAPDQLNERINSILAKFGKGTDTEPNTDVQKEDFNHLMKVFRVQQGLRRENSELSERIRQLEKRIRRLEKQLRRKSWINRLKGFFSALIHRQEKE